MRRAKTFRTKIEARDWAAREEYLLSEGAVVSTHTVRAAFERYAREVSPTKRGERWDAIRLENFGRDKIADKRFANALLK
ncbi:MAG: hypothetical protein AAF360_04330 [Pseudomonadota bacterium]